MLSLYTFRFIAIQMPFRYSRLLRPQVMRSLIVFVWSFAGIWSILGIFNWNYQPQLGSNRKSALRKKDQSVYSIKVGRMCTNQNTWYFVISFYAIYVLILIFMTGIHVSVFRTTLIHIQHIKQHARVKRDASVERRICHHKCFRKELRASRSVAIVYMAFCVCWLPTCVITTIIHVDKNYFTELRKQKKVLFLTLYYLFIEVLPLLNTMVNPIIYSFSNKQFQDVLVNLWRKFFGKTPRRNEFELTALNQQASNQPTD